MPLSRLHGVQSLRNGIRAAPVPADGRANGARPGGETHFRVEIVAAAFAGKSRLERQRAVYAILAEELAAGVHALQIACLAPGEGRNT